MTEHGDPLSRRYRELAREEPSAALDAAILAASRRAVAPQRRMRWATPVSIAAVLVLGIGVALRMQVEEPGIETSVPQPAASAEYPVPQASEAPPPAAATREEAAPAPLQEEARAPAPRVKRADAPPGPAPAPAATPDAASERAPAAPPAARAERPAAPAPEPFAASPPPAAAGVAPQRAPSVSSNTLGAAAEAVPPVRAKRQALAADSLEGGDKPEGVRDARETELERIAKLRAEGRHDEADRALEEFRKRHPGYRIAPAMWERVKPR